MKWIGNEEFEDVSFLSQHPGLKGSIITIAIIVVFMFGVGFKTITQSGNEIKPRNVVVEIKEKGQLVVAESITKGKKTAISPAKAGIISLWYNNEVGYQCDALSSVSYNLDKTSATANTFTKTVTVKAPKQELETHLLNDTYENTKSKQTIFNPVTDEDVNQSQIELEKELNEKVAKSNLSKEGQKSFEKRMRKWITQQDAYKDYKVNFKYA